MQTRSFSEVIMRLLNQYKQILKRRESVRESNEIIKRLGLKQTILKKDDEVTLYHKATTVLKELKKYIDNTANSPGYFSVEEFYQYLRDILSQYKLHHDSVIHTSQKASRALLEALQLMLLPEEKLTAAIAQKIYTCGEDIAAFGTKEQHSKYIDALRSYEKRNINFFLPIRNKFEQLVQLVQEELILA